MADLPMHFDDAYTGPRWTYGLSARPVASGNIPHGFIIYSNRGHPDFTFGTIDYPFELSAEQVRRYNLELIEQKPSQGVTLEQLKEEERALLVEIALAVQEFFRNEPVRDFKKKECITGKIDQWQLLCDKMEELKMAAKESAGDELEISSTEVEVNRTEPV